MLFLSLLGALAAITPHVDGFATSQYAVVHSLDGVVPDGWTKQGGGKFDKTGSRIKLRIQLSQPRISEFYELATKIATPGDKLYGQHLSKEDADAFLAPDPQSLKLVQDWLESENLGHRAKVDSSGDSIVVFASVGEAEKLLKTEYSSYVNQQSGEKVVRTLQYSVPDILTSHIDVIEPTTFFGMKRMSHSRALSVDESLYTGANCSGITPACLSHLYNYAGSEAYSNGLMGVAGFIDEVPSASDLASFMKQQSTQHNADQGFTCVSINGGKCAPKVATIEAALDTQYVRAITHKIPNIYYSTGGHPPVIGNVTDNEPYLEFLNYMLALPNKDLPNTLSVSYGDREYSVPRHYATKCCDLFAKLGARGVSVLVSTGDDGVGSTCPNGRFTAQFPASCPWVTAVGGTIDVGPEKAWDNSTGGFSDVFPQPRYQAKAVNAWLKNDKTHQSQTPYFNPANRAVPDVSALASAHFVVLNGKNIGVYGTSASAPVVAGIVQLLNSDRLLRGQKPHGFLNPWLYSHALPGLTDITHGASVGCYNIHSNGRGFKAVPGWDPVTGFGTPNFEKLLEISRQT
ncbi:hypothetical protein E4U55_005842 [Claviceps digitariae]|nr:hypothetical protein E4U55_005842 [Claviceps digitariae]